jgi:hypothetical protein
MGLRRVALTLVLAVASTMVGLVVAGPAHAMSPCMNEPPPDWCTDPGPGLNDPTGDFSSARRGPAGLTVIGSASDPNGGPVSVDITVNGVYQGTVLANQSYQTFYSTVPVHTAGTSVCATARNIGLGSDTLLGCKSVSVKISPFGSLDVLSGSSTGVIVTGWAVDPDTSSAITVKVVVNAVSHGPYTANLYRFDLGTVANQGYGYYHGYNLSVATPLMAELNRICVVAVNVGAGSDTTVGCKDM